MCLYMKVKKSSEKSWSGGPGDKKIRGIKEKRSKEYSRFLAQNLKPSDEFTLLGFPRGSLFSLPTPLISV